MRELAIASRLPPGLARLPTRINWLAVRLTNRLIQATPRQVIQVPTREPIVSFTCNCFIHRFLFRTEGKPKPSAFTTRSIPKIKSRVT